MSIMKGTRQLFTDCEENLHTFSYVKSCTITSQVWSCLENIYISIWGQGGFCDSVLESMASLAQPSSNVLQSWCSMLLSGEGYLACCHEAMQFVPFLTCKMNLSWMPKVVPQKVQFFEVYITFAVKCILYISWLEAVAFNKLPETYVSKRRLSSLSQYLPKEIWAFTGP